MASNKKGDFKCLDCGNTETFYRGYIATVTFKTEDQMDIVPGEFLEWSTEITCDKCYSEDVIKIETDGELNNNGGI